MLPLVKYYFTLIKLAYTLKILFPAMVFILLGFSVFGATITSTTTGGTWTNSSTWVGNVVPNAGDAVIIATTGTGSVDIAGNLTQNASGSVTVNNGAILTTSGGSITFGSLTINSGGIATIYRTFTVSGSTNISGTINFGSTSGTVRAMTFTGAVTLNSGAVWNETTTGAAATFSFGNSFTNNSTTFTAQNTTHNFNGSGMSLSGSTAIVFPTATFTGTYTNSGTLSCATILTITGVTFTNNGTVNATAALSGTGSFTQGITGILNIGGTSGITTLTATAAGNNVNYTGAAQTVKAITYSNLTLSGSGSKTTTGVTVNGILSMEGTATASAAPNYGTNASLQYNTATSRTAGAEWLATFAASGGVMIANTGTITLNAAKVFNASVLLTINNGASLSTNTNNFQLTFGGDFNNNGGTFSAGASAIIITGTAATQSIDGFTTTGAVTMSKSSGTATFTGTVSSGAFTLSGAGGMLNLGTGLNHTATTLSLAGTGQPAGTFGGTGASATFINPTYFAASTGVLTVATATCVAGTWTGYVSTDWNTPSNWCSGSVPTSATNVIINAGGNQPVIGAAGGLCNNLTINSGATLTISGSNTLNISGSLSNSGTFVANTGTVNYNGAAQTIANVTYYNLSLSGSGAKTLQATTTTIGGNLTLSGTATTTAVAGLTINGNVTIGTGTTFTAGAFTHIVKGNWTKDGTFNATGSTINLNGEVASTVGASNFNNLTISGSGTKTATGAISVAGNFNLTSGGFSFNDPTINSISIGGNYTQSGGRFDFNSNTSGSSTMTLNGNFVHTSGVESMTTSGENVPNGILIFNGTGTQTFSMATAGGIIWTKFSIPSGKFVQLLSNLTLSSADLASQALFQGELTVSGTLDAGIYTISQNLGIAGTAVFTLNSGGTLLSANAAGVDGSISTTNMTRTFNSGANYIFNGTVAQATGSGLTQNIPANLTINNPTTVSFSAATAISGNLLISQGTLNSNNFDFTVGGNWTNNAAFSRTTANVTFNGAASQSLGGSNSTTFNNLTISNTGTSGSNTVTLTKPTSVSGILSLNTGLLATSTTNSLSITNTATTSISGGSATSFINGPVIWTLPASLVSGSTYNFPVGNGTTYLPLSLVNPTTGTGIVTAQVQATMGNSGGSINATLASRSTSEYWALVTSGNFTNSSVSISRPTAIAPFDAVGGSTSLAGTYSSLGGTAGAFGVSNSNAISTNRFFVLAQKVATITTGTISGSPFCAGSAVSVPFTITGNFVAGNVFTAQLSNAVGSFASPTTIGTLTSQNSGTISATIPVGQATGSAYRNIPDPYDFRMATETQQENYIYSKNYGQCVNQYKVSVYQQAKNCLLRFRRDDCCFFDFVCSERFRPRSRFSGRSHLHSKIRSGCKSWRCAESAYRCI